MAGRFCTLATGGKTVNVQLPGLYEGLGPEEPLLLCPAGWRPSRCQTSPEAVACLCRDRGLSTGPVCRQTASSGHWARRGALLRPPSLSDPRGRQAGGLPEVFSLYFCESCFKLQRGSVLFLG